VFFLSDLELRRRIKAVQNIEQVTKAMELVAAAKLRRAQERVLAARPYAERLAEVLGRLATSEAARQEELLRPAIGGRPGYVVFSADRGLCGSYNINVLRKAATEIGKREVALVTVGRKARDFFRRRGAKPVFELVGLGEDPDLATARHLAAALRGYFLSGQMNEVYLVYTEFVSALRQQPVVFRLLPLTAPAGRPAAGASGDRRAELLDYIFEPSPAEVLKSLLPRYVDVLVYRALLEAKASEHSARMRAMGSASDNAAELIHELTLEHNRARQAGITREISEIVGGAEALK